MENYKQQQNFQHQEQAQDQNLQTNVAVCKHCGATLDAEEIFCPECGEKIDGEERFCPICKTSTTSEFCPNCGTRLIPLICPNCGKESYSDFCESCGNILNPQMQQFLEQPKQEIQQMSQEDAERIKKEAENFITPELKQFLNKIEEHRILLEEREYFNKREKRIIKVFGQNPFELIKQSLEEKAFMTKMYEGLKKVVVERRNNEINDKLKQFFPDLEEDLKFEEEQKQKAEQLRLENEEKRAEMEKRYTELLANVTNEVQKAQLAEQKRLEVERLRKEAEERERRRKEQEEKERREREKRECEEREKQRELARLRLEQETREQTILGRYICIGADSRKDYLTIQTRHGSFLSGTLYLTGGNRGDISATFSGTIKDNSCHLELHEIYNYTDNWVLANSLQLSFIDESKLEGYCYFRGGTIKQITYYKY